MKSPLLVFGLKCSVIFYFAACSGINTYSSGISATPLVTKGAWKINLYVGADKDQTNEFAGYSFTFDQGGQVKAEKNGTVITGNWSEDDISKKITISLPTKDPILTKLNDYWNISSVSKSGINLQNLDNPTSGRLQITSL